MLLPRVSKSDIYPSLGYRNSCCILLYTIDMDHRCTLGLVLFLCLVVGVSPMVSATSHHSTVITGERHGERGQIVVNNKRHESNKFIYYAHHDVISSDITNAEIPTLPARFDQRARRQRVHDLPSLDHDEIHTEPDTVHLVSILFTVHVLWNIVFVSTIPSLDFTRLSAYTLPWAVCHSFIRYVSYLFLLIACTVPQVGSRFILLFIIITLYTITEKHLANRINISLSREKNE